MFFGIHKKPWFGMIFGVKCWYYMKFLSWKWCWCQKMTNIQFGKTFVLSFLFLCLMFALPCPSLVTQCIDLLPNNIITKAREKLPTSQGRQICWKWKLYLLVKGVLYGNRQTKGFQSVWLIFEKVWPTMSHGFISWYWGNIFISQSHINRVWATSMSEWVTKILIHRSIVNFLAKTV